MSAVLTLAALIGFVLAVFLGLSTLPQLALANVAAWLAVFGVVFCSLVLLALARIVSSLDR